MPQTPTRQVHALLAGVYCASYMPEKRTVVKLTKLLDKYLILKIEEGRQLIRLYRKNVKVLKLTKNIIR